MLTRQKHGYSAIEHHAHTRMTARHVSSMQFDREDGSMERFEGVFQSTDEDEGGGERRRHREDFPVLAEGPASRINALCDRGLPSPRNLGAAQADAVSAR